MSSRAGFRRFLRWLLLILLAIGLFFGGIAAFLAWFVQSDHFRPWLAQRLSGLHPRAEVEIDSVSLSPLIALEAEGVRVAPETDPDAEPWAEINLIEFHLSLWDLLWGDIHIEKLALDGVTLRLIRDGGQWNWAISPGEEPQAQEPRKLIETKPLELPLRVEELLVENLTVIFLTDELRAQASPLRLMASGAIRPGSEFEAAIAWGPEGEGNLELVRTGIASRPSLEAAGKLEIVAQMEGGDLFAVNGNLRLNDVVYRRGEQAANFDESVSLDVACQGSLSGGRTTCEHADLTAPGVLEVESAAELAWGEAGRWEARVARLDATLAPLSRYLGQFIEQLPDAGGRLRVEQAVIGSVAGDEGGWRLDGAISLSDGTVRFPAVVQMVGIDISVRAEGFELAGRVPAAGLVDVTAMIENLTAGPLDRYTQSRTEVTLWAEGDALRFEGFTNGEASFRRPPLAYDGPARLDLKGAFVWKDWALRLDPATLEAEGVALQAAGNIGLGTDHPSVDATLTGSAELSEVLNKWIDTRQAPWASEVEGLQGPVRINVSVSRASNEPAIALTADVTGRPATPDGDDITLSGAQVALGASASISPEFSANSISGTANLRADVLGYQEKGADGIALSAQWNIDRAEKEWDLGTGFTLEVAQLWLRGDKTVPDQRSGQTFDEPMVIKGSLNTRSGSWKTNGSIRAILAPDLVAVLEGSVDPLQRFVELRTRTLNTWALSGVVERLPVAYRAPLREGTVTGTASWDFSVRGGIPKEIAPGDPIPFDIGGRAQISDVTLAFLDPELKIEGLRGSISVDKAETRPGVHEIVVNSIFQTVNTEWTALREGPLGPSLFNLRARAATLDAIALERAIFYNDALKLNARAGGVWQPSATPAVLALQTRVLFGAPVRWRVRSGLDSTGSTRAELRVERIEEGPLVIRGAADLSEFGVWLGDGLHVDGANGSIPIQTAVALGETPLFRQPPAVETAKEADRIATLLYDEFLRLGKRDRGEFGRLKIKAIRFADLAISDLTSDAAFEGDRIRMRGLDARFLDGNITGRAEAILAEPLTVELAVAARDLNVQGTLVHGGEPLPDGVRPSKAYRVNMDTNLRVSFVPTSVSGEIRLTRLGRDVLRGVLDLIDPRRVNPTLNSVRDILDQYVVLSPSVVTLRASQGKARLDIDMKMAIGGEDYTWWQTVWRTMVAAGYIIATSGKLTFRESDIQLDALIQALLGRIR